MQWIYAGKRKWQQSSWESEGSRKWMPCSGAVFFKKLKYSKPWNKGNPGTDEEKVPQRYADMSKTFSKCSVSLSIYSCPEDGKDYRKYNYFNHFVSWRIISSSKKITSFNAITVLLLDKGILTQSCWWYQDLHKDFSKGTRENSFIIKKTFQTL